MCIRPVHISEAAQMVACRQCWLCRKQRVDDYVGRAYAEAQTAAAVSILTLTYRGDSVGSVLLLLTDVQKMLKLLRRRGYPVRYIVAGELGSRHNRAHWHIVLFWGKTVPHLPKVGSFGDWSFWPHGFVHVGDFDFAWLRYSLKYLLKDQHLSENVSRFSLSTRPPLGLAYFYEVADQLVELRTLPRDLCYSFGDLVDRRGRLHQFVLRGRMAERFLDRLAISWRLRWNEPLPDNDLLLEKWADPIARSEKNDLAFKSGSPLDPESATTQDGYLQAIRGAAFAGKNKTGDGRTSASVPSRYHATNTFSRVSVTSWRNPQAIHFGGPKPFR